MAMPINGFFPGELQPDAVIGGCINIFENVWPNPSNTIELLEKECANPESGAFWQRAETIGQGAYQHARTNLMLGLSHLAQVSDNKLLQNIHNQFNMLLLASTVPYSQRYGIKEGQWHEPYSILKYGEGQEYKSHYDGGTDTGRSISAIVYLNDNYDGGGIEFPFFNVKIKPQAGMLMLFPSNFAYTHIAHPVTAGQKYALVTWIKDRIAP
jgi:predicted 2-oxoglutarate/Fe(II)-dependent dioxygenase YbiX